MAFILADRIKETTTTTGEGALTLAGAVANFAAFNSVMSNTDTTYYAITDDTANDYEIGIGTWNTGNTLTRTTILQSTNSDAVVDFAAGTKTVFITYPADKAVFLDASGNIDVSGKELQSTAGVVIELGDNAGANRLDVQDSDQDAVFKVLSNGQVLVRNLGTGTPSLSFMDFSTLVDYDCGFSCDGTALSLIMDGASTVVFGDATVGYDHFKHGELYLQEIASATSGGLTATHGTIWVKNTNPTTLWFDDGAGTSFQLGLGVDWKSGAETGFNSLGIDDNATGERLTIENSYTSMGSTGSYTLGRAVTNSTFWITGSAASGTTGGRMALWGSTSAAPGRIEFYNGATRTAYWDNNSSDWNFEANNITTTGDVITTGDLKPGGASGPTWSTGSGTPEAAVTAPIGSLFTRTEGGAGTTLYVKESGAGNTGWVAMGAGGDTLLLE